MTSTEPAPISATAQGQRARIPRGERVVGSFVKTPARQIAELPGRARLDFAVADMEHAPIDLDALDELALGARAVAPPRLLRSAGSGAAAIWPGINPGYAGVMAPHATNTETAEAVARAAKYHLGQRGFSPSGRAGDSGTVDPAEFRAPMGAETVIIAQIEDRIALDRLDQIAAMPDVDALFVGPADLSLSLGCAAGSPKMDHAIGAVICPEEPRQGRWLVPGFVSEECRLGQQKA